MIKTIIYFILLFLFVQPSFAASFDCAKASSKIEKMICSNDQISELDEKLSNEYQQLLGHSSFAIQQSIIREQREWLKVDRNTCQDEPSLLREYQLRIQAIKPKKFDVGNKPFVQTDILENHPAPVGKGFPAIFKSIDGDLVYSHYDETGNAKNVVQFDFTTGRWANLLEGKRSPKLIAQDSRFIIFHEPHSASFPIKVLDRKSGKIISKTLLKNGVIDALIDGNNLILFQPRSRNLWDDELKSIAVLKLPELKLLEEMPYDYSKLAGITADHIFIHHYAYGSKNSLVVFDRHLNELGRVPFPAPIEKVNMGCGSSVLQSEDDRAVLTANCGEMHIINLKSFSVERSIPRHAHHYFMSLYKGMIFTAGTRQELTDENPIVVYDIDTGNQVASLPISSFIIAIKGDTLLSAEKAVTPGRGEKPYWTMTTYQLNSEAIRKGSWQFDRILSQCRQAKQLLDKTNDVYKAINLCRDAGIEKYAESQNVPEKIFPILRQYALWLAQTLDKGREAIPILERIQSVKPDSKIDEALVESRLKARVVFGEEVGELSPVEKETPFGKTIIDGRQLKNATSKTINFGWWPSIFYYEDQIYVGRGTSIGVFNRNTFDEVADISLFPYDEEYQDNISSVAVDDHYIYAAVTYKWYDEEKGRPSFFVIDKNNHQILRKGRVDPMDYLVMDGGKLLSCSERTSRYDDYPCLFVDPIALKTSGESNRFTIEVERRHWEVLNINLPDEVLSRVAAQTKDYVVTEGSPVSFYPKAGGPPISPMGDVGKLPSYKAAIDRNNILTTEAVSTLGGWAFKLVSLPEGSIQPLFGLPSNRNRELTTIIHNNLVYVGIGRDLMIYDARRNRVVRFIKEFIPNGFKDNSHGLDANRINRLIIDRGKLIALTFYGDNSRVVALDDLLQ